MAVFALPPEMIGFYKENIEYLKDHAVDPDKRRYAVEGEAPKHYIDIDHFAPSGANPFDSMPRLWKDAVNKYTEDTLMAYGIVPWHVSSMCIWLTKAFQEGDANKVLYLSAEIGHYIADAHVPLHTTENYNGQLSGQKGIHGLWESRIPELDAINYDFLVGKAEYYNRPLDKIWEVVEASHSHLDSVLIIEKDLTLKFPSDQKYTFENRGQSLVKVYSKEFALEYSGRMNDMVEERMRAAILSVASYWYTAWINAGQPNLEDFGNKVKREILEQESIVEEGNKVNSRPHED